MWVGMGGASREDFLDNEWNTEQSVLLVFFVTRVKDLNSSILDALFYFECGYDVHPSWVVLLGPGWYHILESLPHSCTRPCHPSPKCFLPVPQYP